MALKKPEPCFRLVQPSDELQRCIDSLLTVRSIRRDTVEAN